MKKITLLLLVLSSYFLLSTPLSAQDFEVTVVRKNGQLPSYPAAYIYNPMQYFQVSITNNTGIPADVYLTCALEYNDVQVIYSENIPSLRPITLSPGLNIIDNATLEEHFGGRMKLDLNALNRMLPNMDDPLSQLSTATRLPEGDYRMSMHVHPWLDESTPTDPYEDGGIDDEFEILYSATPPEIITPLSEQVNWGAAQREDSRDRTRSQQKTSKREDDFGLLTSMGRSGGGGRNALTPQRKLTFRWSPVITTSSYPHKFEYTLKIVAVLPQQNAQDAIDHNPVVVTVTTQNTYAIIDTLQDMKYQFETGMSYAMQVKATSVTPAAGGIGGYFESIEISNGGKSQVVTFSWGKARYSIQYNELNAPLDTAIRETYYSDNICSLLRETRLPSIIVPSDTVDPATFNIDNNPLQWTPVSGPDIVDVNYIPHIYPFRGEKECTLGQSPVTSNSQMVPGDYYYLDLETEITYRLIWDSVYATVHYVNGIEADTEADTLRGNSIGTVVRHVGKVFRFGNESLKLRRRTRVELPDQNVDLRLAASYDKDSLCIHLDWYHHYKSPGGKDTRGGKKSKGLYHFVVYRSLDGGPFVGIATLPAETESYTDRDIQPGQTVNYFVRLHISPERASVPSNTVRKKL